MDMTGEQTIAAPRERVWAALNDPEILRQAIPGCQSLERSSENELVATVVAKLGPVKANFKGKVTLSDINPPSSYTIQGEGQGGAAGFAKGGAKVSLQDAPEGTLLLYEVQAAVGGKLAQIGSRLIDATARKMADDFFTRFNDLVSVAVAAEPEPETKAAPSAPAAPPVTQPPQAAEGGLPSWLWIGALIVVVLLLLFYFGVWR